MEGSVTTVGCLRARTEIALSLKAADRIDQMLGQAGERVS